MTPLAITQAKIKREQRLHLAQKFTAGQRAVTSPSPTQMDVNLPRELTYRGVKYTRQ